MAFNVRTCGSDHKGRWTTLGREMLPTMPIKGEDPTFILAYLIVNFAIFYFLGKPKVCGTRMLIRV